LGKYYLGVSPVKPGYEEFSIEPSLGGLEWIKGSVPTPYGDIRVFMDKKTIKVVSPGGKGYLVFSSKSMPQSSQGKIETLGNNRYRLFLEGGGNEIIIKFEG
jgi:alpha-L-rhamnosidase